MARGGEKQGKAYKSMKRKTFVIFNKTKRIK